MTYIPVILDDGTTDILGITATLGRGHGNILVSGLVSTEIENEIPKAIRCAAALADLGEFDFPDLPNLNLRLSFGLRFGSIPVSGESYGLGLAVELLRVFANRSWSPTQCFTGCIDECGEVLPVEQLAKKLHGAANAGFSRTFIPSSQLDFWNKEMRQVPVESVWEAWGVLNYGS